MKKSKGMKTFFVRKTFKWRNHKRLHKIRETGISTFFFIRFIFIQSDGQIFKELHIFLITSNKIVINYVIEKYLNIKNKTKKSIIGCIISLKINWI